MLIGIDNIDWESLDGAYGPCTEAPDILRAIASPDPEVAGEGRYEFASSFWHQGTVYPVTAEAVPFLIELATTDGVHQRDHLLRLLGALCDPEQADGAAQPLVRAAVAVHSGPLLPLLADPDPAIRRHAAYAAAWSGPHTYDTLREHWETETDPGVRATLLPGLMMLDPTATASLLATAFHDPSPQIRVAAALATTRAGHSLPPGARQPVADAFARIEPHDNPWSGARSAWHRVFRTATPEAAAVLADTMSRSGGTAARTHLAYSLGDRFRRSRSAATDLLPVVRTLSDPDPQVREAACSAALAAGEAAAPLADALTGPAASGDRQALSILIRLGSPGYREALLTAWDAGAAPDIFSGLEPPPFDPALFTAIRHRIAAPAPTRPAPTGPSDPWAASNATADLIRVLAAWGPAAAGAIPELIAVLPQFPVAAAGALAAFGPAALPAVPALTERAEHGDVRAGHAVLKLTGNAVPLVTAATILLTGNSRHVAYELDLIADAGPAAAVLLPALAGWLTGTAAAEHHELRREQVAAARLAWRAGADPDLVLPTLRAVVRAGFAPAGDAATLLAELGTGHDLQPELHKLLKSEPSARSGAARALHRLGVSPADLADPLVDTIAAGRTSAHQALDTLVAIAARTAIPALTELADRDERIPTAGLDDPSWADDRLRHRIDAAITALAGTPTRDSARPFG
ncbi:hypothetical protein OHA21_22225 [Actinoplanes sp. NBC_00393]|uniref:hypothetical protein n=1 Tax=Actinoplanes sp. NBC_00393 TaxID=2975953 RepID=UPI002E2484A2